ncbi:MAG TPA: hypothetical protein VK636_22120 [Gemmatimonadaceae bacterium]|nr:hypothetical protein [Gemmatimonadaceae bacterium]
MSARKARVVMVAGVAAALSGCLLFVACDASTSISPPQRSTLILGDFGGSDSRLHADSNTATLDYHCSTVAIHPALVSDSSGALATAGQRRRVGGAYILNELAAPVRITGRAFVANGGSLQIIVNPVAEEPGAPIGKADTLELVRGRTSTLLLCP